MYQLVHVRYRDVKSCCLVRSCAMVAVTGVLMVSGCGHPFITTEIYQGSVPGSQSNVRVRVDRIGSPGEARSTRRYPDSPPRMRFTDSEGIIWELSVLGRDPASWVLWVIRPGKEAERVPLTLVHEGFLFSARPTNAWPRFKYPLEEGSKP